MLAWIKSIGAIIEVLQWVVVELKRTIEETARRGRMKEIREALDGAKKAKTLEEKREAACRIDQTLDPSRDCDGKP